MNPDDKTPQQVVGDELVVGQPQTTPDTTINPGTAPESTPVSESTPDAQPLNEIQPTQSVPVGSAEPSISEPVSSSTTPLSEQPAPTVTEMVQPTAPEPPQPVVGGAETPAAAPLSAPESAPVPPIAQPNAPQPKKSKKKKLLIVLAIAFLLATLAGGYVFGYYLPNKPENVYKTGMNRTGEAVTTLVNNASSKESLNKLEKSELKGSVDVTYGETNYKGDLTVHSDKTTADGTLNLGFSQGGTDKKLSAEFMTKLADKAKFPDIYFKVSGIQELFGTAFGLEQYDKKWIGIESSYLEKISSQSVGDTTGDRGNVSAEEVSALVVAVNNVTKEYVFTTDPAKAVLQQQSYVGKEKTDEGITAYHYKMTVNKANAKAYCEALVTKVMAEPAYKKYMGSSDSEIEKQKESAVKECDSAEQDAGNTVSQTFDMWIDSKYKLVHKVRFTEDNDTNKYFDLGQTYTGGDKVALFANYIDKKESLSVKVTIDVDIKQASTAAKLTASSSPQNADNKLKASADFSAKPYSGDVKFEVPSGVVPITDILGDYGVSDTLSIDAESL